MVLTLLMFVTDELTATLQQCYVKQLQVNWFFIMSTEDLEFWKF